MTKWPAKPATAVTMGMSWRESQSFHVMQWGTGKQDLVAEVSDSYFTKSVYFLGRRGFLDYNVDVTGIKFLDHGLIMCTHS